MKAGAVMMASVLLWSLYPLLSVYALEKTDAFSMMLVVQFVAFHGALFMAGLSLWKKKQIKRFLTIQKEIGSNGWLLLITAGACSAFSHVFFVLALGMANKNGISLVFEIWPILAVFFAPHMIDKDWNKTSLRDYIVGFTSLTGVTLIILSDNNIDWFRKEQWSIESILAYGMVLLASYMTAILALMRTQYSQRLQNAGLKNSFASVMVSEMYTRLIAVIFIIICIFGMNLELAAPIESLGYIFLIGFGVFALGGGAFTYALLKSKNANISLFYYLVPVLAVLWLVLTKESPLTLPMGIGGTLTIGACLYLMLYNNMKRDEEQITPVP